MISAHDHERLRPLLLAGERVLWTGRPRPFEIRFGRADLWIVPVLLILMTVLWFAPMPASGDKSVEWAFRLAPICLLIARWFSDAWVRSRQLYAVTNRRVLVLRIGRRTRVKSAEIGDLPLFEYEERDGGLGTLRFDFEPAPWLSRLGEWRLTDRPTGLCFEMIERSREVYDLIQRETDRWRQERYGDLSGPRSFIG